MTAANSSFNLRVPFGQKDGRLYMPHQVERGLACECFCPECGSRLVSNQGNHKRHYFSHHESRECEGGYETSVHLMAKQVVEDHRYIELPVFHKILSRKLPTGDLVEEEVLVLSKRLDFAFVGQEKGLDGLKPDVIGISSDGQELLIEVYVTHAVSDEKCERYRNRNLIELDLSQIPRDSVTNESAFCELVLSKCDRLWHSCRLYKAEIALARQRLNTKARQLLTEHRAKLKREEEERQRQIQLDKQESQRQQEIKARKFALRQQYVPLIERLESARDKYRMPVNAMPQNSENSPIRVEHTDRDDWIFMAPRSEWQEFIYDRFIRGKGYATLDTNEVKKAVVREFGIYDWVNRLIILKYEYKQKGRARNQWYGKKGIWFLTDRENRMIPSPFLVIGKYLNALSMAGFLFPKHGESWKFTVRLQQADKPPRLQPPFAD